MVLVMILEIQKGIITALTNQGKMILEKRIIFPSNVPPSRLH